MPKEKVTDLPPGQEYLNFDSQIGIVATPVIDDKAGTIYVVANSVNGGQNCFRPHRSKEADFSHQAIKRGGFWSVPLGRTDPRY